MKVYCNDCMNLVKHGFGWYCRDAEHEVVIVNNWLRYKGTKAIVKPSEKNKNNDCKDYRYRFGMKGPDVPY